MELTELRLVNFMKMRSDCKVAIGLMISTYLNILWMEKHLHQLDPVGRCFIPVQSHYLYRVFHRYPNSSYNWGGIGASCPGRSTRSLEVILDHLRS